MGPRLPPGDQLAQGHLGRTAHGSSSGKPGQAWRLGNLTADAEKRLRSERSATSWASLSAAEILTELKQDDNSYGATLRVLLSLSDATYEKFLSYDPSAKAKRNEVYVGISKYLYYSKCSMTTA